MLSHIRFFYLLEFKCYHIFNFNYVFVCIIDLNSRRNAHADEGKIKGGNDDKDFKNNDDDIIIITPKEEVIYISYFQYFSLLKYIFHSIFLVFY
jgi:hypothetical protein